MGKTPALEAPHTDAAGRRRFLQLMAGSAAAVMVGSMSTPRRAAAQRGTKKTKKAPATRSAKLESELDKQRKYVASTLETIRQFELPPGSEVGFVFRPLRPSRRRARKRR